MGTTTSPQQQNPQTGADKDPCEVLFSMLPYPRLFTTKSHVLYEVFICQISVYLSFHVCQVKQKTNPSPITSFERQSKTFLEKVFF